MNFHDDRIIFHIDVNSAFLSWSAVDAIQHGSSLDIREIPSAVGGDVESRHGIILAKSIPAKKYKIQTGEPIYTARQKCPQLHLVPPNYPLYVQCSDAMVNILREYSPLIERYSIDECFMDMTTVKDIYKDPVETAYNLKERIKRELGFTVNIGVSNNKLLAKMGSELEKPDRLHTLFPIEIKDKLWPLPVDELFMVGRATAPKLNAMNIYTIGDLANYNLDILKKKFKSYGVMIWNYANGIDSTPVKDNKSIEMKSIGNSTTIPFDVEDRQTAHMVLLSLAETVGMRLRHSQNLCQLVYVYYKNNLFMGKARQRKLKYKTDCTDHINKEACALFDEIWDGSPVRQLGISVSHLSSVYIDQVSFFDERNIERKQRLDKAIDEVRRKYGLNSLVRSVFLTSGLKPLDGGSPLEKGEERTTIF
ncbi:MAG: DNA polymerase IV [Clostridiales bacterium]|nr:DNA polymerase IV [Clostridiales bacterium]